MQNPPKFFLQLLRWFCHPSLLPPIEGDLMELYEEIVKQKGVTRARWWFAWEVLRLFRKELIYPLEGFLRLSHYGLFKSHVRIANRQLVRYKSYSVISILGLSVGLVTFFIILQLVSYETSFDQFHENKDEIYRAVSHTDSAQLQASARSYIGLRSYIEDHFPEVKRVSHFWKMWNNKDGIALAWQGKIFYEKQLIDADASFFEVFPTLLLKGAPSSVLSEPYSIVLSESTARKYFGEHNPIGQVISDSEDDWTVTGVSMDIPANSHLNVDIIRSIDSDDWGAEQWSDFFLYTYLTLKPDTDVKEFEDRLTSGIRKKKKEFVNLENVSIELQPIEQIHLNSKLARELSANSDQTTIYFLAAIGFLILVMAWINHVNLSASRFFARSKEMGIRKIIGSGKRTLTYQLLVEFLLLNVIATFVAVLLFFTVEPFLVSQELIPAIEMKIHNLNLWFTALAVLVIGSMLTGIYPSFLVSRIQPSAVLKGKYVSPKTGFLKYTLVVFQFAVSIVLITSVVIIKWQLDHIQSSENNMEIDQVVTVRNPTAYSEFEPEEEQKRNFDLFKNRLMAHASIAQLTSSSAIPGSPVGFSYINHLKKSRKDPYDPTRFKMIFAGQDYLNVYGIPLLAGRMYSTKITQDIDQKSILLSEQAIKYLGYASAQEATGKKIDFKLFDEWASYEIIGVFSDYRHVSVKSKPYPSILFFNRYKEFLMHHQYHSFKIEKGGDVKAALEHLEETWASIWPYKPLEYHFLDNIYEEQFREEALLDRCFTFFAIIGITLSALGILGITLYETQQRKKEISIRKVLGSSIRDLIQLLGKKYFLLIAVAIAISIPAILLIAKGWLDSYSERISINFWVFFPGVLIILLVVFIASISQIYKLATTNPVNHLRNE